MDPKRIPRREARDAVDAPTPDRQDPDKRDDIERSGEASQDDDENTYRNSDEV